jgi:hypothetical protein
MTKARKNVICFVLPNDRGHFNYTIHIARALDQRGYQIEYFAPAGASEYAPKFAKFTGLTEPSDDRFDRFTRLYCNLCSYGDTPEEGNAHLGENWETSLAKEFPDERGLKGLHGPRENLIALKERVLRPDVALVIFDAIHVYQWIGSHCKVHGVPTLGLFPSAYFLYKPDEEFRSEPDNLDNEPEYPDVREGCQNHHHPALYTVFPPLAGDCPLPKGRRIVGPVFAPGNAIPSDQQEAMASSGLLKWLNNDNDKKDDDVAEGEEGSSAPVVYVSFGSMMRGGRAFEIAKRLIPALTTSSGEKWRVLIAADPKLFEGQFDAGGNGNVRIEKWVPQSAVLAHPKVRAFVSHCGATSCAEAILNGVPVIGLPFFQDQLFNAPALVACGGAVATLAKSTFTQEEVVTAIEEALSDPVQARLKEMSENLKSKNALFEVISEAERAIQSSQSCV